MAGPEELLQERPQELSMEKRVDALLQKFYERAAKAPSDLEKRKFRAIIDKLEAIKAQKLEAATEGAKDVLSDLRDSLSPEQKEIYQSVVKGVSTSAEKANDAMKAGAKKIEGAMPTEAQKGLAAAKEGDVQGLQTAAGGLVERAKKEGGAKVQTLVANEAIGAIFKPMTEATNIAEFIAGFFEAFWNLIKFVISGGQFDVPAGAADKVIETASDSDKVWSQLLLLNTPTATVIDASKKEAFETAWKQYLADAKKSGETPDLKSFDVKALLGSQGSAAKAFVKALNEGGVYKLDIATEKVKERVWNSLISSGWVSREQMADKRAKFDAMLKDPKYGTLLDPLNAVKDNKEWNLVTALGNAGSLGGTFLIDLYKSGVIPLEAIGSYVEDGIVYVGLATTKFLVTHSVNDFVYTVSGQRFEDIANKSPEEKRVLMAVLYHNMSLQLYMTGLASKAIASMGLMAIYWEQGTGFASMKGHVENSFGQYEAMSKTLEHLASDSLPAKASEDIAALDRTLRKYVAEKSIQMRLVALYRANPNASVTDFANILEKENIVDSQKNPKIAAEQKLYVEDIVETLRKDPNGSLENSLKAVVKMPVGKLDANMKSNFEGKIRGEIKAFFTGADQISSTLYDLETTGEAMSAALSKGISEKGGISSDTWLKIRRALGYGSPEAFFEAYNKGQVIINAKTPEEAVRTMQNVLKEIPQGLHTLFFKAIPVGIALHDSAISQDKLSTLAWDLAAINPAYATCILFVEGWNLKGTTLTHPGYLIASGTAAGLTVFELGKIFSGPEKLKNLREFALSPAYVVKDTAAMAARGLRNTFRFAKNAGSVAEAGKAGIAEMAGTVAKGGRGGLAALGIAAAVAVPSAAFAYADRKKLTDTLGVMENRGIFDPETGSVSWAGVKEGWSEWTDSQKESIVRMASSQFLGETMANCSYDQKTGKVAVTIDAPKKKSENVVGIVPSPSIESWKAAMNGFGLSPKIAYSRKADEYLKKQFEDFRGKGLSKESLEDFRKKIDWIEPA